MKIAAIPYEVRRSLSRRGGEDVFDRIDYTTAPRAPQRRRRRPDEDVGNPSTIYPKAPTIPDYVSERNPHGTEYVRVLIERIDSGLYPHELDERRKVEDADADATPLSVRDAS